MQTLFRIVIALGALFGSAHSFAQSPPCSATLSFYEFLLGPNPVPDPVAAVQLKQDYPECFGGSSSTSTTQINATVFGLANTIFQSLANRVRRPGPVKSATLDQGSGLAAGNAPGGLNFWTSHSENSSRVVINNGAGRNDADTGNTVIGGDLPVTDAMTLGLSVAADRSRGASAAGATSRNVGYTLAPYLGYQLSKEWSLDLSAGLGKGTYSAGTAGASADRRFAAGSLGYTRWNGSWQLSGKGSYLHGEEKHGDTLNAGAPVAGTASTNRVDQVRFGAQAAYWMEGFMPYAGLGYTADIRRASTAATPVDPLGRRAYLLDIGVNVVSVTSKLTGGIAFQREFSRTNSRNETLMATLNIRI